MHLPDFLVPLIIAFIIQLIKIVIDFIDEKTFHIQNIWRAGGFPSVHSGISSSITTLFFFKYGMYSPEFTISFIFSFLFWYDAMNVRYEAGKHAREINLLKLSLKNIVNVDQKHFNLKERLGHTFYEVIGGIIIGCVLTIGFYYLFLI